MVKEEEIMTEAGGGRAGYMDTLGLGEEAMAMAMAEYFLCMSPSPSYLSSAAFSTTTSASAHPAASPTCASYLPPPAGPYHHILSFSGRPERQQYLHGGDNFGAFQYYGAGAGGHAVLPLAVPHKSSPTTECSSSMSSSPTATADSAPKRQATKRKGSRGSDQRRAAPAAAASNKRPKVRRGGSGWARGSWRCSSWFLRSAG